MLQRDGDFEGRPPGVLARLAPHLEAAAALSIRQGPEGVASFLQQAKQDVESAPPRREDRSAEINQSRI